MTHTAAGAPRDAKTAIHAPSSRMALMLGALGVVYGDIGTSPLYTLRACLKRGQGALAADRAGHLRRGAMATA